MFGKKKQHKVKVRFDCVALRVLNLPSPKGAGRRAKVAWKTGSRKANSKGESEPVPVGEGGVALLDYRFSAEATLSQDITTNLFDSKKKLLFNVLLMVPSALLSALCSALCSLLSLANDGNLSRRRGRRRSRCRWAR